MKWRAAAMSDIGRLRRVNQDQYLVKDETGVFAVADGMGGHAAGEVASRLAIEALADSFSVATVDAAAPGGGGSSPADALRRAFDDGNRRIESTVEEHAEWRGMGTTIVALLLRDDSAVIGHVGDSRAYLLRNGELRRLTSDHSWVNERVQLGLLTAEQAAKHPMRNIVTRALGNQSEVAPDIVKEAVRPGDVFVLCSDGLNSMISDEEIRSVLDTHGATPQDACRALVESANRNGGEDNITVLVLSCHSE